MPSHTQIKNAAAPQPFHPGVHRFKESIYIAYDAESIDSSPNPDTHMPIKATANVMTALFVLLEMAIFLWLFGIPGLVAIAITTVLYTLMDKRARLWLRGLLQNNSDGSAG